MNHQYYCFDARDINVHIGQSLLPHLGPMAVSGNYSDIIQSLFENILYPYSDYPRTNYYQAFEDYSVDEEVANEIVNNLIPLIARTLNTVFTGLIGSHLFDIEIDEYGVVYIEDLGPIPPQHQETQGYDFSDSIKSDIEEGHYVPPRFRRLAGFY